MDAETHRWFANLVAKHSPRGRILEVGSFNVNGTIRDLFDGCEYIGIDMREGPGVDRVANSQAIPFGSNQFAWVISTSHLEHDDAPWASAYEMMRVLRHGGRLVVTAPGFGWPVHDHPSDYWRFSCEALRRLFEDSGMIVVDELTEFAASAGTMVALVGRKRQ